MTCERVWHPLGWWNIGFLVTPIAGGFCGLLDGALMVCDTVRIFAHCLPTAFTDWVLTAWDVTLDGIGAEAQWLAPSWGVIPWTGIFRIRRSSMYSADGRCVMLIRDSISSVKGLKSMLLCDTGLANGDGLGIVALK